MTAGMASVCNAKGTTNAVFAIDAPLLSYLILACSRTEDVAMDVAF